MKIIEKKFNQGNGHQFQNIPPVITKLTINGLDIDRVSIAKHFGIYVSSHLKCDPEFDNIHDKAFKSDYVIICLNRAGFGEN